MIHTPPHTDDDLLIPAGGRRMKMDWDRVIAAFQSALDRLEWDADLEVCPEKQYVMIRYPRDISLATGMTQLYSLVEDELGVEQFMSIWIDFMPKRAVASGSANPAPTPHPASATEGTRDPDDGSVIPAGGCWMTMDWVRIDSALRHASTKLGWDAEFELFPAEQRVLVRFPGDRAELVGTTMTEFYRTLESAIGMEEFMSIWIEYLSLS